MKPRARLLPCRSRTTTLADCGYEGAGTGIHVPVKNPGGNQELAIGDRARNRLLRGLRFQGERGFALLTRCWTVLQHTTASPREHHPDRPRRPRPHPIRAQIPRANSLRSVIRVRS